MRVSMLLGMRNSAGQCVGASGTAPSMPPAASAFRTRPSLQRAPKTKSAKKSSNPRLRPPQKSKTLLVMKRMKLQDLSDWGCGKYGMKNNPTFNTTKRLMYSRKVILATTVCATQKKKPKRPKRPRDRTGQVVNSPLPSSPYRYSGAWRHQQCASAQHGSCWLQGMLSPSAPW
eukprot:scaffold127083_cov66-Phaeocystis_antarctica.AAC.2